MEKNKLDSLLIDYIDGTLAPSERQAAEDMLLVDEEARKRYEQLREVMQAMDSAPVQEPSPRMQSSFHTLLQEAIAENKQAKTVALQPAWYRVAAVITLLMLGGGAGLWIYQQQQQQAAIREVQAELAATKSMMMAMLGNNQSASQRVLGASVAYNMQHSDDEVVRALAKAMTEDPNTNVRLAALEALGKFKTEPTVRKLLIASLAAQKDPIVQITLIRMLVEMKEKGAVDGLQRITNDQENIQEVKDEAHAGLLKLS